MNYAPAVNKIFELAILSPSDEELQEFVDWKKNIRPRLILDSAKMADEERERLFIEWYVNSKEYAAVADVKRQISELSLENFREFDFAMSKIDKTKDNASAFINRGLARDIHNRISNNVADLIGIIDATRTPILKDIICLLELDFIKKSIIETFR